jgi:hypothetical protein
MFKRKSIGFYNLIPVRAADPVGPGVEKDGWLTCFRALSLVSARVVVSSSTRGQGSSLVSKRHVTHERQEGLRWVTRVRTRPSHVG